ncbi:hypothetical protein DFP72DRAFT_839459 [Ephemerocybe angulata]|uniref:Uncharacterized protein n=1 Tax=Ephemerocybe angulata TaxID=980116 RepID=A0A8H6MGG8_9AGAR|nr:hypothetical protein DFP72DRAFT_839459 [Tulosesus angulatus]
MARRPNGEPRSYDGRDRGSHWTRPRELEAWVCGGGKEEIGEDVVGGWQEARKARVKKAKGVVLITSLTNEPGCPSLNKPSEVVPTFSKHLSELVPKYLDHAAYHVALGGAPEITKILELKWARIARTISAAAVGKHLTSMTLELGGKSPVIFNGANLGKGVCAFRRAFGFEFGFEVVRLFVELGFEPFRSGCFDIGSVVRLGTRETEMVHRLQTWDAGGGALRDLGLTGDRSGGGDVRAGLDDEAGWIRCNLRGHGLRPFLSFSLDEIPFGGVDESGYGKQPLKYTFEEFVCLRSVLEFSSGLLVPVFDFRCSTSELGRVEALTFGGRYPPSSKETLELLEGCSKVRIPSVEELGGKVNEMEQALAASGLGGSESLTYGHSSCSAKPRGGGRRTGGVIAEGRIYSSN